MNKLYVLMLCVFFGSSLANAQFLEKKKDLETFKGYYNFYYSEKDGEHYLEVPKKRIGNEFLYVHSLRTGLGSNDIGLDRGQLGDGVVVKFIKSDNKLLLLQPNLKFRAITDNNLESKSIDEAFAKSVLFAFDIKETKGSNYIIDLTPFLFLDVHGVAARLKRSKEGVYKQDKTRNTLWMERTKAFPKNVEFEAMLTFVGEPTGKNIRSVAPDPNSLSVIQHHSFVELPDDGYQPRSFDPRSGSYPMDYLDYSTPIWEPIKKRIITRHRLEKKDPLLAVSEAKEPIIYYLDPGTPEPVRSALLEGASWWNQAFESIGYKNAFQVQLLPEDADPMDVRYNVIQWVHRSTRGWSYGASITDPRTGEIIKGHVSLGSLRIRQDFMIAQALMNKPFAESDSNYQPMLEMALARIRQLSAHEVGHTLGFAHNYAASTNNRSSVMDYPHPTLRLVNGIIDFSDAYATGIGDWDKVTVAYSYSDKPPNMTEKAYLTGILTRAQAQGMQFITDSDARAPGGAHAKAHLWDNGNDVSEELTAVLALREKAIAQFSQDNIRTGDPYTMLEDVFVPLYFYHRFQTEAAVKKIGGMDYNYAVKGDEQLIHKALSKQEQQDALEAVLQTLDYKNLMIPNDVLALFPPRAFGYGRNRESFKSNAGVAFDPLGAAATASDMTLSLLLNPERLNRMVAQRASNPESAIPLEEMFLQLVRTAFKSGKSGTASYEHEVARTIQYRVLLHLLQIQNSDKAIPQVKAATMTAIESIKSYTAAEGISANSHSGEMQKPYNDTAYKMYLKKVIEEAEEHPERFVLPKAPKIPDGSPIGSFECFFDGE